MAGEPGRSGGHRAGAGNKPQEFAQGKKRVLPPMEYFDPPSGLDEAVVKQWMELAQHAFEARTLTRRTMMAFVDLCKSRALVLEMEVATGDATTDRRGGPDHRAMIQRVQSQMKDFALAPFGKPVIQEEVKEADPFAEFDVQ